MRSKLGLGRWRAFTITDRHGEPRAVVAVALINHNAPERSSLRRARAPNDANVDGRQAEPRPAS